jgi:hypothetical protein
MLFMMKEVIGVDGESVDQETDVERTVPNEKETKYEMAY